MPVSLDSVAIAGSVEDRATQSQLAVSHMRQLVGLPAINLSVPGQSIVIDTGNNTIRTFIVERLEPHSKNRFPTAEVYCSTNQRVLRFITCGGQFDPATRSYRDNIVVFARLAE